MQTTEKAISRTDRFRWGEARLCRSKLAWLIAICMVVQFILLGWLSEATLRIRINLALVGLVLGALSFILFRRQRMPYFGLSLLAMLALGNLGMLVGWSADYGFGTLVRGGLCLCACPDSPIGEGLYTAFNWMYGGMALASLPAFLWIKPDSGPLLRASPRVLHAIVCVFSMIPGMYVGAWLAGQWVFPDPGFQVRLSFVGMSLGMIAGMLAGCFLFGLGLRFVQKRQAAHRL